MDGKGSSQNSTNWTKLLRGDENDGEVNQLLAQFQDETALQLNLNSHIRKNPLDLTSGKSFVDLDQAGLDRELAMRYAKLKAPSPVKKEIVDLSKKNKAPSAKKETGDSAENDDSEKETKEEKRKKSGSEKGSDGAKCKNQDVRIRVLTDEEEERILGQELAVRFAALKTSNSGEGQGLAKASVDRGLESQEVAAAQLGIGKEEITEVCSEAEEVQKLLASVQDSIKLEKTRVSGSIRYDEEGEDGEDEEISDSEVDKVVEWVKDASRLGLLESEEEDDDNDEDIIDGGHERSTGRNLKI